LPLKHGKIGGIFMVGNKLRAPRVASVQISRLYDFTLICNCVPKCPKFKDFRF